MTFFKAKCITLPLTIAQNGVYLSKRQEVKEMRVECNDMKCKATWELKAEDFVISGNRIVAGPPSPCPVCGRIDRPYIVNEETGNV